MKKKLAAIVVLFNPEQIGIDIIKNNIESYSKFVDMLYIIDNSFKENLQIRDYFPNAFYYCNKNRNGIAGAQNFGCTKAIEDGFDWVMTMDQDSKFDEDQLREYLRLFNEYSDKSESYVSFTLEMYGSQRDTISLAKKIRYSILSPIKRKFLGKKDMPKPGAFITKEEEISFPELKILSSANIINLKIWEKLGKFDESLFIDQVDNDYSMRLIENNYKIVKFNHVFFRHTVGERKFSILSKYQPEYGSFRLYYIFRNHYIMRDRHPNYSKTYNRLIYEFFVDNCIHSFKFFKNFIIFIRAYKDYKKYVKVQKNFLDFS